MKKVSAQLGLLACLTLTVSSTLGQSKNMAFTFLLPAGGKECFYQTTARNGIMEVEYKVIAGSGLDVGFTLFSPTGHRLASDFRRSDSIHVVNPTEDGDYRLCFDNTFSKLSVKMVFFEVIIISPSAAAGAQDEWAGLAVTDMVEYKLEDIRARMGSVYHHLERSRQLQTALRSFEARDRYLLESNLWRISFWSCINLLVMIAVSATQIYTLRCLFDGNKRVCT
ncbi:transmembrane emp24 domain-containing protein 1a [Aulostomus maculatus]